MAGFVVFLYIIVRDLKNIIVSFERFLFGCSIIHKNSTFPGISRLVIVVGHVELNSSEAAQIFMHIFLSILFFALVGSMI